MDGPRLDGIARTIATGMGRRRVAAGVAAALLGGLALPRPAAAACKNPGRRCDRNQDCCDGAECRGRECRCKTGRAECGNDCVKTDTDEQHCGRCNRRCDGGAVCRDGLCEGGDGGFPFVTEWGRPGSADGRFDSPRQLGVAPAGQVYVADTINHRIQAFSGDGDFLGGWGGPGTGDGEFTNPFGVAIAADGDVFVTDLRHRVQRFDGAGIFKNAWGEFGTATGQFDTPNGVAVDGGGNVLVADTNNDRVQRFRPDGTFL
jgi:hypothetical protein